MRLVINKSQLTFFSIIEILVAQFPVNIPITISEDDNNLVLSRDATGGSKFFYVLQGNYCLFVCLFVYIIVKSRAETNIRIFVRYDD